MALINSDKNHTERIVRSAALIDKIQNQLLVSDIDVIKALIAQDPRPAYRRQEIKMPFVMRYKSVDVSFQLIESGQLQITAIVAVVNAYKLRF